MFLWLLMVYQQLLGSLLLNEDNHHHLDFLLK